MDNSSLNTVGWFLTIASVVGTVLNVKKMKVCFVIWLVTNVGWCVIDWVVGLYAQSAMFAIYVGLSVWGIVEWRR